MMMLHTDVQKATTAVQIEKQFLFRRRSSFFPVFEFEGVVGWRRFTLPPGEWKQFPFSSRFDRRNRIRAEQLDPFQIDLHFSIIIAAHVWRPTINWSVSFNFINLTRNTESEKNNKIVVTSFLLHSISGCLHPVRCANREHKKEGTRHHHPTS